MKKEINKVNKIGILGGTFDPPHKGHLYISKVAIKKIKLNKLIWAVTKKNPLKKKPYLSIKTRIKLSKIIVKKEKKIFIKYFEKELKSSATYDLLKHIKNKKPKIELFFLMGADNLKKLHKWKNWKSITKLAKIVIFPRKNYSSKLLYINILKKVSRKDFIYIKSKKINISSSLIRKFW